MDFLPAYFGLMTLAYRLPPKIGALLHQLLCDIAEQTRKQALEWAALKGKGKAGVHRMYATKSYVIIRHHILRHKLKAAGEKLAIYRSPSGDWICEFESNAADPESLLYFALTQLSNIYDIDLQTALWEPLPIPFCEVFTATYSESCSLAHDREHFTVDRSIRRFNRKRWHAERKKIQVRGYEGSPITVEIVVSELVAKRNQTPDYAKIEIVPIHRQGHTVTSHMHRRIPPFEGHLSYWLFAIFACNILCDLSTTVWPVTAPARWKATPLDLSEQPEVLQGKYIGYETEAAHKLKSQLLTEKLLSKFTSFGSANLMSL